MKKLFLAFTLIVGMMISSNSQASNYKVDDANLDAIFNKAVSSTMINLQDLSENLSEMNASFAPSVSEKSPIVAIMLDFFIGGLGIHRFYLGTKPLTGIGYIITCGGFLGLMPLVDLIVLAVNYNDISKYVDNPRFFMW